jgi:ketosteroid isomerase-like protein
MFSSSAEEIKMSTVEEIRELGHRWAEAEERGDVQALDALATEDFTVVGPAGFVLDKKQWLDRYSSGAMVTESLSWEDIEVREYGNAAVAIGRVEQQASYQGRSASGRLRATHFAVRGPAGWVLAGQHFSPIAGPPAAAPASAV